MTEPRELRLKNGSVIRFTESAKDSPEAFKGVLDPETIQDILQAGYEVWLQEEGEDDRAGTDPDSTR